MDILLLVLQTVFILPIAYRLLDRKTHQLAPGQELVIGGRQPGLLLHLVGLLLVWIGFGIPFWTVGLERSATWQNVTGNALGLAAVGLMYSSFLVLRSWRFLARIERDHELCTRGIYRVVRHPIYVAFDLLGIGLAIAVPSMPVLVGALMLIVGGEIRARDEERVLIAAFGQAYRDYMGRVAGRIPGLF